MRFIDASDIGPGFWIQFADEPSYHIGYCIPDTPITVSCSDKYKIWTFRKQNSILQLSCNGVEIFHFDYASSSEAYCKNFWSLDFVNIIFARDHDMKDTASDSFRHLPKGDQNPRLSCTKI